MFGRGGRQYMPRFNRSSFFNNFKNSNFNRKPNRINYPPTHIKPSLFLVNNLSTTTIRNFTTANNNSALLTGIMELASDSDLERILQNTKHCVLLDFYADWCGPCKQLTPLLTKTVETPEFKDKVTLVKVNTDLHQKISAEYKISSLPTVMAVKDGKIVEKFVGSRDAKFVHAFIQKNL